MVAGNRSIRVSATLLIDAPIDRVFALATDPAVVPRYALEIARLDILERHADPTTNASRALVRSHLRLGRLTLPFLYEFRYRPPRFYTGVQQRSRLLRGWFSLRFTPRGDTTEVAHAEGLRSPLPGLAPLAARLMGMTGASILAELQRLKEIVERGQTPSDGATRRA